AAAAGVSRAERQGAASARPRAASRSGAPAPGDRTRCAALRWTIGWTRDEPARAVHAARWISVADRLAYGLDPQRSADMLDLDRLEGSNFDPRRIHIESGAASGLRSPEHVRRRE